MKGHAILNIIMMLVVSGISVDMILDGYKDQGLFGIFCALYIGLDGIYVYLRTKNTNNDSRYI